MDVDYVKNLYYQDQLSTREIGERLGKTVWQIIKFMKKHNIPRRSPAETNRLIFERLPLSFNKLTKLTTKEERMNLHGLRGRGFLYSSSRRREVLLI